jgi:hypothetical protein
MKPNEFKVFAGFMFLLICILIITVIFSGCESGWSIAGWEI